MSFFKYSFIYLKIKKLDINIYQIIICQYILRKYYIICYSKKKRFIDYSKFLANYTIMK